MRYSIIDYLIKKTFSSSNNFLGLIRFLYRIQNKLNIYQIVRKKRVADLILKFHGHRLLFKQCDLSMLSSLYEIFGKEIYGIHINKNKVKIVVDLGSFCGFYLLYAYFIYPKSKIISLEPYLENFKNLEKTILDNKLDQNRILIINKAISNKDGIGKLYLGESNPCCSTVDLKRESYRKIQTISLPTLKRDYRLNEIDILKMDIEGAEHDFIYALAKKQICQISNIVCELHEIPDKTIEKLVDYLKSQGFNIVRYDKAGSNYVFSRL